MIDLVNIHVQNKFITKIVLCCIFSRISKWVLTRSLPTICVKNFVIQGGAALNYHRTIDILYSVKYLVQAQGASQFAANQWKVTDVNLLIFSIFDPALSFQVERSVMVTEIYMQLQLTTIWTQKCDIVYHDATRSSNPIHIFSVRPSCELFARFPSPNTVFDLTPQIVWPKW